VKAFKLAEPPRSGWWEIPPPKYTCDGSAVSPRFAGTEPPPGTKGLTSSWPNRGRREGCSRSIGSYMESP